MANNRRLEGFQERTNSIQGEILSGSRYEGMGPRASASRRGTGSMAFRAGCLAGFMMAIGVCACDKKQGAESTPEPAATATATATATARKAVSKGKFVPAEPTMSPADEKLAKDMVGAISRGATAAYEREQSTDPRHVLCRSAEPVPAEVPKAQTYEPHEKDFLRGSDRDTGWKCLKLGLTIPFRCQYGYIAGGPYKSAERGNKDAPKEDKAGAPTGFEAYAECDFDGDGETSLYARTGTIVNGRITFGKKYWFIDKKGE